MELTKKYNDTIKLLQKVADSRATIKDENENLTDKLRELSWNSDEANEILSRCKDLDVEDRRLDYMDDILLNNMIHIQQQLLYKSMEYYKEHYINKRLGEKTREKIKKELEEIILKLYNIEVYVYIRYIDTYSDGETVEITVYFKDYYYSNVLKNEAIRYNEKYGVCLYYYRDIAYIEDVEDYTNKLYEEQTKLYKDIEEMAQQLNNKIDLYNLKLIGALNNKRIREHYYIKY